MLCFVQKELEKSSVTKGFVRQQALKEKGEKRTRLFFLLLLLSRTAVAAVATQLACVCRYPWGRMAAETPEPCSVLIQVHAVVVALLHVVLQPLSLVLLGIGSDENPLLRTHSF